MSEWIFIDYEMPPFGVYVLTKTSEDSPISITQFDGDEWETGANGKRVCFYGKEKFYTSASVVFWMHLPDFTEHYTPKYEGEEFIKGLEKSGLIGCFDGTGVNSENYKPLFTEEDLKRTESLLQKVRKNRARYHKHLEEVKKMREENKELL